MPDPETMKLPVRLTDAEMLEYGELLATFEIGLEQLKDAQKEATATFTEVKKEKEREIARLAQAITERSEIREVEILWTPDYARKLMQCVRKNTGAFVTERALQKSELEGELFPQRMATEA